MLAGRERCQGDGKMQVIRGGIVNYLHIRVCQQGMKVAVSAVDFVLASLLVGGLLRGAGDGDNIHVPEAPDCIDMVRCDKTGADQAHANFLHRAL